MLLNLSATWQEYLLLQHKPYHSPLNVLLYLMYWYNNF